MSNFIKRFALLILGGLVTCSAFADSVTLTANADTHLFEPAPDNNAGGNPFFSSGANFSLKRTRSLVKFNLAGQIPANASIQSASLTLTVTNVPFSSTDSIFDLHRLLVDWGEGTGTSAADGGRAAVAGEATWNHRFHPSTSWSAVGAAAPGDFSSTVSTSKLLQDVGTYTFSSTPEMVADIRQWVANPSTNFGWILISESEDTTGTHRMFASRESSANNKPTLVVQFVIPVTPTIKSIQKVGSTIQFIFTALAGQPYTAEYRDSLTTGTWLTLENISPQPSTTDVPVTDSAPPPDKRFYRVTTTF
jgi:hypothetical protein